MTSDNPGPPVYRRQNTAFLKLVLYVYGETHAIFARASKEMGAALSGFVDENGKVSALTVMQSRGALLKLWGDAFRHYATLFYAAQREAATIPFGTLAELHRLYFGPVTAEVKESAEWNYTFAPQLQQLIDAATRRYLNGLALSDRLWQIDSDARAGIIQVLMNAVAGGESNWDTAKKLEQFLGASARCPRWTSTRLNKLTKKDIAAGDPAGLYSGDDCAAQGVAYNALRLARTELSYIQNMATQELMRLQPWVKEEQMMLSPAHPKEDVCDDIIHAGRDGKGIYPVGTLKLPIHPNCMCWLAAVTASIDEFTSKLKGWMKGETSWPEMDDYSRQVFWLWQRRPSRVLRSK